MTVLHRVSRASRVFFTRSGTKLSDVSPFDIPFALERGKKTLETLETPMALTRATSRTWRMWFSLLASGLSFGGPKARA
jgi:hypothetical protein